MPDEATIERVKAVVMKYCNPKKEFDGIKPREVIIKIIEAVGSGAGKTDNGKSWDAV